MIGFIRGTLITKTPPQLLIEVQGIGYEVEAPMTTFYDLPDIGQEVKLHTHLVVREDAHILFAFATPADRTLFRSLIKINGVGPKLALVILSGQNVEEFYRHIHHNDIQALVRLPGIGKKTAERLVIEMSDRLPVTADTLDAGQHTLASNSPKQEAISALCSLGYKPPDAQKMVQNVAHQDKNCEHIIKLALQGITRK